MTGKHRRHNERIAARCRARGSGGTPASSVSLVPPWIRSSVIQASRCGAFQRQRPAADACVSGNPYSQLPPPAGAGTGSNSAIKSIINIDYYHPKLHFCQPHGGPHSKAESLGSVLFGDRIYDSPIQAHLLKNESCVHVCTEAVPSEDMTFINDRITEQYAVNWMVDGLPVATKKIADRTKEICE
ncbi:hypothetical protein L7F22_042520 [Adiantum nelumboides]|nr:hypothetical protein [Adiantum nelumboides]